MKKLWIFGDSFADDFGRNSYLSKGKEHIIAQQWHLMTASQLLLDPINQAKAGCSLDWTMRAWYDSRSEIEQGDHIVIVLTSIERRWFFEDLPNISIMSRIIDGEHDDQITKRQVKAVKYYAAYLHHNNMFPVSLENWFYNISHLAYTRGCPVVVLPAFPDTADLIEKEKYSFTNMTFAKGSLSTASFAEFSLELTNHSRPTFDGRCNHFSPCNHHVLTHKLVDFFTHGAPIDLTTGFHQYFIEKKDLGSPDIFLMKHIMGPY